MGRTGGNRIGKEQKEREGGIRGGPENARKRRW